MKQKSNRATSIFLFVVISILPLHAQQIRLSFDSLFPASLFKKALDSCMQSWNDMQLYQEFVEQIESDNYQLLLETTIGRLVYAQFCLEHMVKTKYRIIPDDVVYLMQVVKHIQQLSEQEKKSTDERLLCIQKTSKQLQLFLKKLIIAYNKN
jgi:hypothetical protein